MTDTITSLQNTRVKLAHQLQKRARVRRKEQQIVLEGTRLIADATQQGYRPDFILYEPISVDYEVIAALQSKKAQIYQVTEEIIQHVSDTQNPQGIVGVYRIPKPPLPPHPTRILILDAIREPGNMGTILRTAGAAGVELVILAPECVDPYNPKVLRSGMGAHLRIPIIEATWKEITGYCSEINVYLAAGDGQRTYTEIDWTTAWALVIGNEAHGVGQGASNLDAERIRIPMASATESVNAAIATGVILFEAQRQRL